MTYCPIGPENNCSWAVELWPPLQVDRLLAFIDLDRSLLAEDARSALAARLEAVAMEQEQFLILFGKEEDRVVELEPRVSSYQGPTCLFLKQIHTSAKVQYGIANSTGELGLRHLFTMIRQHFKVSATR